MAILKWIGGGDNQASDPNDWVDTATGSPAAFPPQLGDQLNVGGSPSYTMNIQGNDLAGDPLNVGNTGLTANLSDKAVVTAGVGNGGATFNVSGKSTINASLAHGSVTVNLSQNSTANVQPYYGVITVNVSGNDTVTTAPSGVGPGFSVINLSPGARLSGTLYSNVGVHGASGSTFNNDGNSYFQYGPSNILDVDVTGTGTMTLGAGGPYYPHLTFTKSVGPHQSILDGGLVEIDQPNQFAASITMTAASSEIDLTGLATADGYSYKNDMLNILSGNKIIDTLRLTDQTPYGFDVVPASGGVSVVALTSSGETLLGALPPHLSS
jgi:hypothetical protein